MIYYYDPEDVSVSIDGREVTGFATSTSISIARSPSARVVNRWLHREIRDQRRARRKSISLVHPFTGAETTRATLLSQNERDRLVTKRLGQEGTLGPVLVRIALPRRFA